MVDLLVDAGGLLVALFLVLLNGFFVASEFAFVRVRSTTVAQLAEEGRPGSGVLTEVMDNLDDYLAVTQLGITIASLGLGWVGEPAVASLIEPVLASVLPGSLIHVIAFAIAFSFITFLHVVFGELAPKTISIAQAERVSLFVAPPMKFFYWLFYPGIVTFNGAANAFTRAIGIPRASEADETLGEREIRRVLTRSGEAGHVDLAQVEMIDSVFDLDDVIAREFMVPWPDVIALDVDASLADVRATIDVAGHTRYPVVDGEELVGFLDVKDVLRAGEDDPPEATAGDLARDAIVIPETMTASDLLIQFRERQLQLAVIVDEWGALEGIATIEDVVETIVGDLQDSFDAVEAEPSIRRLETGVYDVDGSVPLSAVNAELSVDLESEGYDTIGGLVMERLGRVPESGDQIDGDGWTIEVHGVEDKRVTTLRLSVDGDGDGDAT